MTNRDKDICSYAGVFGILISATCLIQNLIYFLPHWITTILICIYILSIVSFSLLTAQHLIAPLLLIITASLLLLCGAILLLGGIFSLIVILLFIYATVIASLVYMEGLPSRLKQKALADRAEKELWKDKI